MGTQRTAQGDRILLALTGWAPDIWLAELRQVAPDRQVVLEPDGAADPSIRYAIVWKQRPGILDALPNLEVIFSIGAGVDHIFREERVPNVPIVRVVSPDLTMRMSEYVVWQVLDHHRQGPAYREQQRRGVWREDRDQPAAGDVCVGIMGLGQLGTDAAVKLSALGFRVSGWSRRAKDVPSGINAHFGRDGLEAFLAEADILVCLLPLTPETTDILAAPVFGKLKKGGPFGAPILINAGRGMLQNEADILVALERSAISAVTLDVFRTEPLPADSPLWRHPRVTVTPHAAATSSPPHLIPPIIAQMRDYEAGKPLRNVVDRKTQY